MGATKESRKLRASWVPAGRRLHLVDIENLCGGSHVDYNLVPIKMDEYEEVVEVAAVDHMIVACSPQLVIPAKACRSGARVLIGRGVDGADKALLGAARVADVSRRYDEVVIASGDHIFRKLAIMLRLSGVQVTVVSRASALAAGLAEVAVRVVYMPELPLPSGEVRIGKVA